MTSDNDKEDNIIPQQPSDLSKNRKEWVKEFHLPHPPFQFEYRFKPKGNLSKSTKLREWLDENGISVKDKGNRVYQVGNLFEPLYLDFRNDSDGNFLRVTGSILAFNSHPDLIDVLKSPDSPVKYNESKAVSVMESVRKTPLPYRFEFIYDPDESFDKSYEECKSILQWIVDQEVVRFIDENKFKEPGDDHPTFIRIRETSEGKPILMLEGYSIEGGEILDHLTSEESPFEFKKRYVVGRNPRRE